MALGIAEPVANINSSVDTDSYSFASFTPTAGARLVAIVAAFNTNSDVGAVSDSGIGLTWTKRRRTVWGASSQHECYLFESSVVPGSPSATVVTFSCTGDAATGCGATLFEVIGSSGTPTFVQAKDNSSVAASGPNVTMDAALLTGNAYLGAGGMVNNPPGVTEPASWTETADLGHASSEGHFSAYRVNGETGTSVSWTGGVNVWAVIVVEYEEAGAAAPRVPGRAIGRGIMRGVYCG
jgi:hypothetical protein